MASGSYNFQEGAYPKGSFLTLEELTAHVTDMVKGEDTNAGNKAEPEEKAAQ
jgi:hypothetical protein